MNILYLSQYFPPEAGATQTRAHDMARNWVRLGHQVTMITEIPNHPSGIIPPSYRGKYYEVAELDGIRVIRVWVAASPVKNFRTRMAFYLSYMVNAVLAGLLLAKGKYDLLYASSPPLFVGGAALALSYLRRLPLIFEIRDLWPESAVALGEIRGRMAIQLATYLEETCYKRASRIVVVTEGIRSRLVERGVDFKKLILIPNGANIEMFRFDNDKRLGIRRQAGWENHIVVLYAGIFGLAQGIEIIIEVAQQLANNPDYLFVLIGDGPKKADLTILAAQYDLPNLIILEEQPREAIPGYLSSADIVLIPLRKLELFKGVLPSKLFDAWACERPVLLSVDGEARQLLESCQGGFFVPPEDDLALIESLNKMRTLTDDERHTMGTRGRELTERHYSRKALAEKLMVLLEEISSNGGK